MNKTQEIRDLAKQVAEIAYSGANYEKRFMWESFNNFDWNGPPPVLLSLDGFAFKEILPADCLGAKDPVYSLVETQLRKKLWYASLDSDMVIEPWIDMSALYYEDSIYMWGIEMQYSWIGDHTVFHGELEKPSDIEKMHIPKLHLDGTRTLEMYDRAAELLDDILDIRIEWRHRHLVQPNLGVWTSQFFGQQRFLEWCIDYPDIIHRFFEITVQAYIQHNQEMERRGRLTDNHCFIPDFYAWHGLTVKKPKLSDLWVHSECQEFTSVSPSMLDEYLLAYIRPIFAMYGEGSFGCCESLNGKMDLVKTLPNLKRVTLSEQTNWNYAIEILGDDYLYVVRPSLVDTIYCDNENRIRNDLKRMAERFKGLRWELNFPGGMTLNGDPKRFHKWVAIAKDVLGDTMRGALCIATA